MGMKVLSHIDAYVVMQSIACPDASPPGMRLFHIRVISSNPTANCMSASHGYLLSDQSNSFQVF